MLLQGRRWLNRHNRIAFRSDVMQMQRERHVLAPQSADACAERNRAAWPGYSHAYDPVASQSADDA